MTYRQTKAIQNMVENGGNMYRAMLDAGYSPAMAKNPHKLTRSSSVSKYISNLGMTSEKAILSLAERLDNGTLREKIVVAKLCMRWSK